MFFVLSKLLNVFISPLVWVILLVLVSLFVRNKLRKLFRTSAFVLLLLFSNGFIFNIVSGWWEVNAVKAETLSGDHRTVVVLGGMATENMHNGLPRFAQSSDRLWQGFWLLKQGYADTLVITGGLGNLFDDQRAEGELLREYLTDVELMNGQVLIESTSRNTFENAHNTARLFKRNERNKDIILVTSAFHVRRARACFTKQGFDVEVFPADPLASVRPLQWKDYIIPSSWVLSQWDVLFREWAGMIMYKINGYI